MSGRFRYHTTLFRSVSLDNTSVIDSFLCALPDHLSVEQAEESLDFVFIVYKAGMQRHLYNSFAGLTVTRQIAWSLFAGFELALLVIWANRRTPKNRAELPSAALSFVGAVLLGFLSFVEHLRSIRPSFSLNVYLLFTTLFDIERSRTYALEPDLDLVATIFASRLGIKVFLSILEAREKRRLLLPEFADCPPEATSGVYKRATFWWLNELFKKGFSNSLTVDDLFQLDKHLQADYLHHILGSAWSRCKCFPGHTVLGPY
jgi:ATP-binding cassette subfamily C (CFTR/MRP) protein 1